MKRLDRTVSTSRLFIPILIDLRNSAALFSNFLQGLEQNNTIPERVLLQLGAKYYRVHLGPSAVPQEELDGRCLVKPNFYFTQEDCMNYLSGYAGLCGFENGSSSSVMFL